MTPGKFLIIFGLFLVVLGVLWQLGWLSSFRLGRLPGDIVIERPNFRVYFPITTGILLSLLLSLIFRIIR